MKRSLNPLVEALETKALLSHLSVGAAALHHESAPSMTHANARVVPELNMSLTTDQSIYAVGQNVQMDLIATNNTRHNVSVWVGPNTNVFSVAENGQVIWRSNSGPQPLHSTGRLVLDPGQSLTLTANWTATATGTFVVHNTLAPHGPSASFSVAASQPAGNATSSGSGGTGGQTTPPVSPPVGSELAIGLTTDQSSYKVGESVQMSLTATNDTGHDVTVWVGPGANVFTVRENGQVIWQSDSGPQPLSPTVAEVLVPGQSLTLKADWTATATGTFVVSNEMAPQGPTATFSVAANQPVPPPVLPPVGAGLAISLTTNHSSYVVGQVVQMDLTATDDTNHDVTVWVGPELECLLHHAGWSDHLEIEFGTSAPRAHRASRPPCRPVPHPGGELEGDRDRGIRRAELAGPPGPRGDLQRRLEPAG